MKIFFGWILAIIGGGGIVFELAILAGNSVLLSPDETLLFVLAFEAIPAGAGIALVRAAKYHQSSRKIFGRALFFIGLCEIALALVTAQMFGSHLGGYGQMWAWLGFGLLLSIVGRIVTTYNDTEKLTVNK